MNTKFVVSGLMMVMLSLASCTKEDVDNSVAAPEEMQITRTVAISDEEWVDDARSNYTPEIGISLDGTETVSVYYSITGSADPYKFIGSVKGTPGSGSKTFSFTHPVAAGAEAYDYYFMMPWLPTSKQNSTGTSSYHRIGPVQMPKVITNTNTNTDNDTFDPNFDYIAGKPVLNVAAKEPNDQSVSLTQFKRIMAPLRLMLSDDAKILDGQKIQQVTISFDDPTDKASGKTLSGLFYHVYSENYDDCKISGWEGNSMVNAATADYPNGLEQNGNWETWLMVNPTTIATCYMTITVVSDKMRITRTIPTGKEFNIVKDKINTLSINVTGDGYTQEHAYSVDFTQDTNVPSTIIASDGYGYDLRLQNCTMQKQEYLGNALRLKNAKGEGAIVLPKLPEGAVYKAIYLTENTNNTSKAARVSCKFGDQEVDTGSFSYYDEVTKQGGVLKLEIPAEAGNGPLTITHECEDALWINRMTVTYEGDIHAVDQNDYYSLYMNGYNIAVGDKTVNIKTHPDAKLVYMDSGTDEDHIRTQLLQKGGVIFLDTFHNENMSEAADKVLTLTGNLQPTKNTIIIGRYKDKQSLIECVEYTTSDGKQAGTYVQVDKAFGGYLAFKNLNFKGHSKTSHLFAKGGSKEADITDFIVEDCTVSAYQNVFSFSNTKEEYVVQNVYFNNSIFEMLGTNGNYSVIRLAQLYNDKGEKTGLLAYDRIKSVKMNNCVVYTSNPNFESGRRSIIEYGYGATANDRWANPTTNLNIVFTNNTLYNAYASGACLVRAYQAKSATIDKNLYYLDVTKKAVTSNPYMLGIYAATEGAGEYSLKNNVAYTYGVNEKTLSGLTWIYVNKENQVTYTQDNNTENFNQTTQNGGFESTLNIGKGYFPSSDKNVGATYDTKLWNTWE